jgi:NADH:ubiquinone oxidoreductase subunit F (NADH-binding)
MPINEPVLTKRIPTAPWGDPKDRRTIDIDEYVRTGGYQSLEKALASKPEEIVDEEQSQTPSLQRGPEIGTANRGLKRVQDF